MRRGSTPAQPLAPAGEHGSFAARENAPLYCASKAGLASLARGMAFELAAFGIRVNAVAPGDRTPGPYSPVTPLARKGRPVEIGEAAAFLLSDLSPARHWLLTVEI